MNLFLTWSFLFCIGSVSGWCLEVFFRRFFPTTNPDRKWMNPGFCTGPYLPIYGFGLCALYELVKLDGILPVSNPVGRKLVLFLLMALSMTAIEYIAGVLCLKVAKVRLWDYTGLWGNIQGIICPMFSLMWGILGVVYYWLLHPCIQKFLNWYSTNLTFSFVIGLFFGVFLVDLAKSAHLVVKLRQWAQENNMVVRYEALKVQIRRRSDAQKLKFRFWLPFRTDRPLSEYLKDIRDALEQRRKNS